MTFNQALRAAVALPERPAVIFFDGGEFHAEAGPGREVLLRLGYVDLNRLRTLTGPAWDTYVTELLDRGRTDYGDA